MRSNRDHCQQRKPHPRFLGLSVRYVGLVEELQESESGPRVDRERLEEVFDWQMRLQMRGPRLDISQLPPAQGSRTMLERHKNAVERWFSAVRTQYTPRMGPVHFDYVENMNMNAPSVPT